MPRWLVLIVGVLLAGCVGMQSGGPAVQKDEAISVEPSQAAGYDYLVVIPDNRILGFDPNDAAARGRAALAEIRKRCDVPQVVGETAVKSGGFLQTDEISKYAIKVRC